MTCIKDVCLSYLVDVTVVSLSLGRSHLVSLHLRLQTYISALDEDLGKAQARMDTILSADGTSTSRQNDMLKAAARQVCPLVNCSVFAVSNTLLPTPCCLHLAAYTFFSPCCSRHKVHKAAYTRAVSFIPHLSPSLLTSYFASSCTLMLHWPCPHCSFCTAL